jgi:hypothetical protein
MAKPISVFMEEQITKAKEVIYFLTFLDDRYANPARKNSFKSTIFCWQKLSVNFTIQNCTVKAAAGNLHRTPILLFVTKVESMLKDYTTGNTHVKTRKMLRSVNDAATPSRSSL